MSASLRSQVAGFSEIQADLLSRFAAEFPGATENLLLNSPKRGELRVRSTRWVFLKHGLGLRFTDLDQGLVIDAHKLYPGIRSPIDAWRLVQYLESTGMVGLTERGVAAELAELAKEGFLRVTAHPSVYETR